MPEISRVDAGRRRASAAKRAVALTAVGGFVAVLGLARQAHPGTAAAHPVNQTLSSGISSGRQSFSLGGGSIGPSSGGGSSPAPQVQTATS